MFIIIGTSLSFFIWITYLLFWNILSDFVVVNLSLNRELRLKCTFVRIQFRFIPHFVRERGNLIN